MNETEQKIRSFRSLSPGWHYGSGVAPTNDMIAKAVQYEALYRLLGYPITDAFPGADGEIMVTAYHGDFYVELTLETDGSFRFACEAPGSNEVYIEGLLAFQAMHRLFDFTRRIKPETCRLYESFILATTMTPIAVSSRTWRSVINGIAQEISEFPVSPLNVPSKAVEAFAGTYANITKQSQLIQQFSGFSVQNNFHLEAV